MLLFHLGEPDDAVLAGQVALRLLRQIAEVLGVASSQQLGLFPDAASRSRANSRIVSSMENRVTIEPCSLHHAVIDQGAKAIEDLEVEVGTADGLSRFEVPAPLKVVRRPNSRCS